MLNLRIVIFSIPTNKNLHSTKPTQALNSIFRLLSFSLVFSGTKRPWCSAKLKENNNTNNQSPKNYTDQKARKLDEHGGSAIED